MRRDWARAARNGALSLCALGSSVASASDPWTPIEQLERRGDHAAAARAYVALLADAEAVDARALGERAEHIVAVVRAERSDSEGLSLCARIADRIEPSARRTAISLRLRCAESELSLLADRRRASGAIGPDLYAIEREARALSERLRSAQHACAPATIEWTFATALLGRAQGLLGDESAALAAGREAARAWAALVDAPGLLDALASPTGAAAQSPAVRAPVFEGRPAGPSERERSLRAQAGDAIVDRAWSAVVELLWVAIERDRRAVTSLRIEPLAPDASDLQRERWYSRAASPVLDRHRSLLEPATLVRYRALWNADTTSARFASALRVGELFWDYGARSRAVQDTLIERSAMADALRGYVAPADAAYLAQARQVFAQCVREAQRAGVENEWTRACSQRLRALGSSEGVVIDEVIPSLDER